MNDVHTATKGGPRPIGTFQAFRQGKDALLK